MRNGRCHRLQVYGTASGTESGCDQSRVTSIRAHCWRRSGIPRPGRSCSFLGTARDHSEGKTGVTHLEYEAYPGVVVEKIEELVSRPIDKWDLVAVVVEHRVGEVARRSDHRWPWRSQPRTGMPPSRPAGSSSTNSRPGRRSGRRSIGREAENGWREPDFSLPWQSSGACKVQVYRPPEPAIRVPDSGGLRDRRCRTRTIRRPSNRASDRRLRSTRLVGANAGGCRHAREGSRNLAGDHLGRPLGRRPCRRPRSAGARGPPG